MTTLGGLPWEPQLLLELPFIEATPCDVPSTG